MWAFNHIKFCILAIREMCIYLLHMSLCIHMLVMHSCLHDDYQMLNGTKLKVQQLHTNTVNKGDYVDYGILKCLIQYHSTGFVISILHCESREKGEVTCKRGFT